MKMQNNGGLGGGGKRPTESNDIFKDFSKTLNSNGIFSRTQIDRFNKFSRFGFLDPYNTNTTTREYLFFTKMDLHLFEGNSNTLNPELKNNPFFEEAFRNFKDTMIQMQWSIRSDVGGNPYCNLLSNTVASKLDLQDINMETLETAANIAGTRLEYPLATTTSSNIVEFSLEFEDTKNLDVYMFFRIWYEYELLKANGLVSPPNQSYITNRILHDVMVCYKITVGEDLQTIIHWSKLWGVYPTVIPRSAFSDIADGPLKIPVNFKAQWVEDMDPSILSDLNKVSEPLMKLYKKDIPLFSAENEMINGEWCHAPHIVSSTQNNRRVYKLKWR